METLVKGLKICDKSGHREIMWKITCDITEERCHYGERTVP